MSLFRSSSDLRPRFNVGSVEQSQANDGVRRNLQDVNNGPFVDGSLITNIPVVGNFPVRLIHNLGRPVTRVVVMNVVSSVNQITVRLDTTNASPQRNPNVEIIIRPSATGTIDVWVS